MKEIKINVADKVASAIGSPVIVCGNSNYKITFIFDSEWGAYQEKTARFTFRRDGIDKYIDVLFSGNSCTAPILTNIERVSIGVYAGDLRTTTGAEIRCRKSILCLGGLKHEQPPEDVYNQILETVSKKLGSEGGTVTGDYSYNGNTFIHEGNLELIEPKINEEINEVLANEKVVETASGSAITIESANAPLQSLKLYGKTTQDGTPTPTEPKALKSVGDSGSFMVGVYGRNLLEVNNPTQQKNGGTFTNNGDGSVTVSGTFTAETTILLNSNTNLKLPKGKYKMVGGNWFIYLKLDGTLKEVCSSVFEIGDGNYTIQAHIWIGANSTVNFTCKPMLLLLDETDTTFVKGETPQTLTMSYNLRSVGEVADEVDFTKGSRTENTYKKVFTGTESFNLRTDTSGGGYYFEHWDHTLKAPTNDYDQNTICNRLPVVPQLWGTNKSGYMIASDKSVRLRIDGITTVAQLQAKLKEWYDGGNPLTIITERATPIETPLSETELNAYRSLMTNSGNTTILSEADMTLNYYTPKGQALGNIHTQINKDYLKLQQAITNL